MKKVLLLSMPYAALSRQALGLSLLKARLGAAAISCEIRYLGFLFADMLGFEDYQWIATRLPYIAFAGDWSFTGALYGERPEADRDYVDQVLRNIWHLSDADIERLMRIRSQIPAFLDACMNTIHWQDYAIVGFTSTFEQNIASLALAKRIKATHPHISIVFGGANWEGEMGCGLLDMFKFVDYACSGEAENSFLALVEFILDGDLEGKKATDIPGVIARDGSTAVLATPGNMIRDMDALPLPDYEDYFRDLKHSAVADSVVPTLLFETSRGCWWGAKSHCTFCGLNGGSMAFRSKSPRRALDELDYLVETWQVELVEAVDNILDMKYFANLLPALAQAQRPTRLFYEVKANLSRRHIQLLHAAGVRRIQPGLESMSDHILKLMRKGTQALKNIQLLKWCKEYGIWVDWNLLYGFPGETREDYSQMLQLLRSIRFLQPPGACGRIRLDRFSPYYEAPADYGFVNVRPMAPYKYLYPFDESILHKIAYYFDYDYAPEVDPTGNSDEVLSYVRWWQNTPETGLLYAVGQPDGTLLLVDTRSDAVRSQLVLTGAERVGYEYCDEFHSAAAVTQHLREHYPDETVLEEQVRRYLDSLVANHLMVTDGSHYLSLALGAPARSTSSEQQVPVALPLTSGAKSPLSSYLQLELKAV